MDRGAFRLGSPLLPERPDFGRPARVVAVANKKGGAGKSTTVVNLAAEMAARGLHVLVVDLDPQGHAGLGFARIARPSATTAHDAFRHHGFGFGIEDGVVATDDPMVDLLPADRDFDGDVHVSDPKRLARALAPLVPGYDVVLIDTPPSFPRLIVAALMAADLALAPTLLDPLSVDGVTQFLRAYHRVVVEFEASLLGAVIVPSRVDLRSNMQKSMLATLATRHGRGALAAGVRIDVALPEAFGAQRPVRDWRPAARAVADFAHLTDDVLARIGVEPHVGAVAAQ